MRENSQIWTHLIFQPDNKSETNLRFSIFKPFFELITGYLSAMGEEHVIYI